MRLSSPPTLLSLLGIVLTSSHTANAKPYNRRLLQLDNPNALEKRCANPCGSESQYCCTASETCVTSGLPPIAQCVTVTGTGASPAVAQQNVGGNGQYQLITTTWTETDLILRTSTYSVHLATPTTQQATVATGLSCDSSNGESPCGTLCCAMGQFCQVPGQCAASGGGVIGDVSSFYYSSVTATDFIRPTSNTVETITSTGSATTTVPFQSAGPTLGGSTAGMTASTTNNGLSGGAIAGIVIGVLAGIILLLLICGIFCFKGLLDGFLAIFGLGKKRRRQETTYIEERHSHHTGGASRPAGRTWWGADRPARILKKDSGKGGAGAVALGLGTLAVILGLKRKRDRRDKESYGTRSSYSYGSYTGTSESE
ncbi:MAG: hypothetical protein Q9226_008255 [Calogaya cf. arnoldii]